MSSWDALAAYRDDGPLAGAAGLVAGRLVEGWAEAGRPGARGRHRDPTLLTVAGVLPVAAVAALPGGARPALGVGIGWLVCCAGAGAGQPLTGRRSWLVPPLLRAAEYGVLARLAVLAEIRLELCYAFLAVLAFHHYDVAYRIRTRGSRPPDWLRLAAGGWDGRLVVGYGLLLGGRLSPGFAVGAPLLGTLFVAESARSWRRDGRRAGRPPRFVPDPADGLAGP